MTNKAMETNDTNFERNSIDQKRVKNNCAWLNEQNHAIMVLTTIKVFGNPVFPKLVKLSRLQRRGRLVTRTELHGVAINIRPFKGQNLKASEI